MMSYMPAVLILRHVQLTFIVLAVIMKFIAALRKRVLKGEAEMMKFIPIKETILSVRGAEIML